MPQAATPTLLSENPLGLPQLDVLRQAGATAGLSPDLRRRTQRAQEFLQRMLQTPNQAFYGINTGFGALCNTVIDQAELAALQRNLLMSHACGTGPLAPAPIVRLMLALKARALAMGHSGVAPQTVQRLVDMLNHDCLPVVHELGSLGASGDLAPLAHLALPLLGLGEADLNGQRVPGAQALAQLGWEPLTLGPKEGLALLNGTQFMAAYGVHIVLEMQVLSSWANCIAALSADAFNARPEAFHPLVHSIRPHPGQVAVAASLRRWLEGSATAQQPKPDVQDPYSFRCVPQVHGAAHDMLAHASQTILLEANAVSDNPNLFPEHGLILAGGNFHGQHIALALDSLCLALAQLGGISERRVFQLQLGLRGLPPFLTPEPGLHSGFMILQYTAASVLNQLKHTALPVSHDSIVSSAGQEDFVSMGANAATKCLRATDLLRTLLAIELLHARQALWLRKAGTSPPLERILEAFANRVAPLAHDRVLAPDIEAARQFLTTPPEALAHL